MSDTIFHITGGLGKHVLSTAVINSYKAKFPDKRIIVSSAYPDVFFRNPNVEESLDLSRNQYFYKNYIYNKDVEIFAHEPYKQTKHILQKSHLIDTWCEMVGIERIKEPSLHFGFRELEIAAKLIEPHRSKPILIFQPFGGPINQQQPYCWARDIHPNIAQQIVNMLKDKYNIIHICNPNHVKLNDVVRVEERLDPHILFSLLTFSDKRILIDSSLQHAASVLGLDSTVFWGVTSPKQFGYSIHNNIVPDSIDLQGTSSSYFFDYEIGGNIPECPYTNYEEIYNIENLQKYIKNNF